MSHLPPYNEHLLRDFGGGERRARGGAVLGGGSDGTAARDHGAGGPSGVLRGSPPLPRPAPGAPCRASGAGSWRCWEWRCCWRRHCCGWRRTRRPSGSPSRAGAPVL
ncbi:hypothetical protein LV779_11770 [Streptomyces thinghirensis]|nr:hypothetical protein [Streptomyces thinghirensis]